MHKLKQCEFKMVYQGIYLLICILYFFSHFHEVKLVQVTTGNGIVEGTQFVTAEANKTCYAFMGIPYAEPPIGQLRFQPPQPVSNWTGVWNATYERDVCLQLNIIGTLGSENCLFLNIFNTELPTSSNSSVKPVLFFIPGGGFAFGSGNIEGLGPDYLVNQDIVVVTMNYRLGVIGFLSTEDLVLPGNNGLKDQILALRWVKSNIAYFGGDPDKITIFGQSAGSSSVSYLVQSPLTTGLFHGAIMDSGSTLSQWSLSRTPRQFAFEIGRRLLIFTNDSDTLVEKLREVDYATLQTTSVTLADQLLQYVLITGFQFTPVREPEHPGAVFTGRSCELLKKGEFNRVPILIGFNSEEANWLATTFDLLRPLLAEFDFNQAQLVPVDMNINSTAVGHLIHTHYVGLLGSIALSPTGFIHYFSDTQFVYPTRRYVKFVSDYGNTYYYQFSYEGNLGNPNRGNLKGAGHGEETHYIFWMGSASDDASPDDKLTRDRMVAMWTNFVKYGNPTPEADPVLQDVTWSVASTSSQLSYLNIDTNLEMKTNPHANDMNFWDNMYNTYSQPPCYTL